MTQPRWLDGAEARAWRGHVLMSQLLARQTERDLQRDSKLSGADYAVLVTLSEDETHRVRMTELADRMSWSKSRLSHQVARMEDRGLVRREGCGEDARGSYVVITDEGLSTIKEAAPAHVDSVRRHLLDHLTDEQVRVLGDIEELVVRHLLETAGMSSECKAAVAEQLDASAE